MYDLIVLLIVFSPLLIMLLCEFIKTFIEVMSDSDNNHNYITFDRFIAFYNINPDRWELYSDYVQYGVPKTYKFSNGQVSTYTDKYVEFYFTFKDRIKYKRWKSNRHKLKKQQEHFKEYQEVLECVKKDLEEFNRKNDEMIKHEAEKYAKAVDEVPRMFENKHSVKTLCGATGISCSSCSLDPCALRIAEYRKR